MAAPVSTGTGAVVLKIRIFQERRLFMVKSKTMTTESTIATTEQVTYDSDMMSAELDKIQLNKSQTIKGILRLVPFHAPCVPGSASCQAQQPSCVHLDRRGILSYQSE